MTEKFEHKQIEEKKKELEEISQTELSEENQKDLEHQRRALSLIDLQKRLRLQAANDAAKKAQAEFARENPNLKRSRRSYKDVREKFEVPKKVDEAELRKKKHTEFLEAILQHRKVLLEFHAQKQAQSKKVHRQVQQFHSNKERQELKRKERESKERLRLLKQGNEEAYRKHVEETKNMRLAKLLEQTDECLSKLGALVVKHKDDKKEAEAKSEVESSANLKKIDKHEEAKTYYQLAHTIEEEITKQPEMLAGGELKPYQLIGVQWLVSLYNNNLNGAISCFHSLLLYLPSVQESLLMKWD